MNRRQLSDAMTKGIQTPNVVESKDHYITGTGLRPFCRVCALGAALVGHYDGNHKKAFKAYCEETREKGEYDAFADLLGIDIRLAVEIEFRHMNGMPIQQIAAWLKSSDETEAQYV